MVTRRQAGTTTPPRACIFSVDAVLGSTQPDTHGVAKAPRLRAECRVARGIPVVVGPGRGAIVVRRLHLSIVASRHGTDPIAGGRESCGKMRECGIWPCSPLYLPSLPRHS